MAIEINGGLNETNIPEWISKERSHWSKKDTQKGPRQQLQANNVPTDHIENTNDTSNWACFVFVDKPWTVS